jgi:hypothetical protein
MQPADSLPDLRPRRRKWQAATIEIHGGTKAVGGALGIRKLFRRRQRRRVRPVRPTALRAGRPGPGAGSRAHERYCVSCVPGLTRAMYHRDATEIPPRTDDSYDYPTSSNVVGNMRSNPRRDRNVWRCNRRIVCEVSEVDSSGFAIGCLVERQRDRCGWARRLLNNRVARSSPRRVSLNEISSLCAAVAARYSRCARRPCSGACAPRVVPLPRSFETQRQSVDYASGPGSAWPAPGHRRASRLVAPQPPVVSPSATLRG